MEFFSNNSNHIKINLNLNSQVIFLCLRLEAEIEEAHLKAKEEMMQGIQMAKEVAQKELSDQKARYEERIQALERELVHKRNE